MSKTIPSTQPAEPLDEVLLAMDVVDTLRHRAQLVDRELDTEARKSELIARLKEIYAAQGIAVPERILADGVKALEEHRFTYTPPRPSFSVHLAKLYVARARWWKPVAGGLAALIAAGLTYQFVFVAPARAAAERTAIALTETLPAELDALHSEIMDLAATDKGDTLAAAYYQDGLNALRAGEIEGVRGAIGDLETLRADLTAVYDVRIRYRGGVDSGFFRTPDANPDQRNYYLIVEAVSPQGHVLRVPISSEEQSTSARVEIWAQRVSLAVFNRVVSDKNDDQIIQNDTIGRKARGTLAPRYNVDTPGGAILEW